MKIKIILFLLLLSLTSCDMNLATSITSSLTYEIPKIKIDGVKYNDYSKYIDYETLNIINFGEVENAQIITSKNSPINGGDHWMYTNNNDESIAVVYNRPDPYKISSIYYIHDNTMWSNSPLYSNDRIISITRWKYEHYMFFKNVEFDESIHDKTNLIYKIECPNDYEKLISKHFSEEVAYMLSLYNKNFYLDEASVQKAVRSNGEEYYSINGNMHITYLNGILNFVDANGIKIIDNNKLNEEYIFSNDVYKITKYIEKVVTNLAIDYSKNPTDTKLSFFNKNYRLSINVFKYTGTVGDNEFELYYKYNSTNQRWQFYRFIFNTIDYSESVLP